jgi:hypothetical protein
VPEGVPVPTGVVITGSSVGGDLRIEKIQSIGAVYQIFPAPEPRMRIPVSVKGRLNNLLVRHTPFGGRDAELVRLNSFVSSRSSGYVFVSARAGHGKTALLANWINLGIEEGSVCYHFISRMDGVADEEITLLNLCQQLAAFHELGGELPARTVELRSLFRALISIPPPAERKLIVVLDGLDEALNWSSDPGTDLFPDVPPERVCIVLSAREMSDMDWLAELGLDPDSVLTLHLDRLGIGEVADLLRRCGSVTTQLASNPEFLRTLHDKSEGDPLYLHFLLQDMRRKRITKTNVDQLPAGLEAYLERWWEQLDEDFDVVRTEIKDLLGILSVARGPLQVTELARITPALRNGLLLKRELSGGLRRYLIGNGTDGYALEFIPIKSWVTKGSGAPGSCAGHNRVPSRDRGRPPSTAGSGLSQCGSA